MHACCSHFMKNAKDLCKQHYKGKYRFGMYCISMLLNANTIAEFALILYSLAVVLQHIDLSPRVKKSSDYLSHKISMIGNDNDFSDDQVDFVDSYNEDVIENDYFGDFTKEDYLTRAKSPFASFFRDVINNASVNDIQEQMYDPNPFYSPILMKELETVLLPSSAFWSGLLLGDLNRHTNIDVDINSITRNVRKVSVPRTIGHAESRMKVLKSNQLSDRNMKRIDELLSVYYQDLIGIQRRYSDQMISSYKTK